MSVLDLHKGEGDCSELIAQTAIALEDNATIQQMFVRTQRNNLELCMKDALQGCTTRSPI
jgi:hypothetical protein